MRSVRLGDLCRRFGVSYEFTPNELRSAYHHLCKYIHPDLAAPNSVAPDAADFIKLREDYNVALNLRKLGYVGTDRTTTQPWRGATSSVGSQHHWSPHLNQQMPNYEQYGHTDFGTRDDVIREFDIETRIKGTCILVFGSIFFAVALREFLVATAGSFWAYKPPFCWSSFVIRRYAHLRDSLSDSTANFSPTRQPSQRSEFYEKRLNKSGICRVEKERNTRLRRKSSQSDRDSDAEA